MNFKMTLAVIISAITLTGCAVPQGRVVDASDVGQVRTAAERESRNGSLEWHNGTGVVYKRANTQCGKNCANHAELAMKMDREKAEREARGNPEWEALVDREKAAYRRNDAANRCYQLADVELQQRQEHYYEVLMSRGYKAAHKAGAELVHARKTINARIEQCINERSKSI